jgi:hypothetical protein
MSSDANAGTTVLDRRAEPSARRHISETELVAVPAPAARRPHGVPRPPRRGRRLALLIVIGLSLAGGAYAVVHGNDARVGFGAYEGY